MLRVALFGAGRIGQVHAASVAADPRADLAYICDPATEAATTLTDRFGGVPTTDIDAVMADESVDAVIIGSPTSTHVDLLTRAVRAGKAALCEKPIDLDLARVDACWAEIKDIPHTVMIGFNRRFDVSFRAIRDRVAAGEVGRLEQLAITSRDPAPPPDGYVTASGGLFRDMTIHDFDMARYFLGDIVSVHATGANLITESGDIDSAIVVLRSAGGALAQITNSRRCAFGYDQRLEAFGATGMLSAGNQLPTMVRYYGPERTDAADPYVGFFLERYTPAYRAELDHFLRAVEDGRAPSPSFADGRAALALAEAADESMRTGAVVTLGCAGHGQAQRTSQTRAPSPS
ncbi:myo-inositol 2-dehydrogenase / D-chiro-inositol 1-dehydrogenase [Nakamurella panacisegetis]|uniref:Myo-inositol 2-dehydrogenase / D-chiro-inositol 1-dehydrogenase n=1 Tax=Nakamurella panacisegetis TaxID=1090615 RepID=A0A1H0M415_9ACTN|nr:inositol 2-dehydrogenase [Nakamurella panacisegetis]SDO75127.1 myo-inositol 2-dehydrogenase / D-chiro-inositol 1-dehydrogenase [Nakamurella panacisegetis]